MAGTMDKVKGAVKDAVGGATGERAAGRRQDRQGQGRREGRGATDERCRERRQGQPEEIRRLPERSFYPHSPWQRVRTRSAGCLLTSRRPSAP